MPQPSGWRLATASAETLEIGIGTQNTTTNTVTGGVVLKELGLLEKHLPKTGKYKDIQYKLSWQNATSGPPITNGMMANNIQIGMMGDYPLMVNGATGQATKNETQLVAIIAYNAVGGGNGIVVHKDSPFYELADLKGKNVSVPFGSAAHGMMLTSLQKRGLPPDFWNLVSQSPEVGTTNLQEKRIDAHGDFVPFAELLPFKGFARKIYDGAETKTPTFHGVVVRKDFGEKYPEIVVAYINALMEANDWMRKNPKFAAEKIEEWTKINKEVIYIFLGPGGVHTLDATIKPQWVESVGNNYAILQKLNMIKELNIGAWVNDKYVRQAFKEKGLDYDKQLASFDTYNVTGTDPVCNAAGQRSQENRRDLDPGRRHRAVQLAGLHAAWREEVRQLRARSSTLSISSITSSASRSSPTPRSIPSVARTRRSRTWCRSCSRRMRKPMPPRTAPSWRPMPRCSAPSMSDNRVD